MIDRKSTEEILRAEQYAVLFGIDKSLIASYLRDMASDVFGDKALKAGVDGVSPFTFFHDETRKTFGVRFDRDGSDGIPLIGHTFYTFDQAGHVTLTGDLHASYGGDGGLPELLYANSGASLGQLESVRKDPLQVSLEGLSDLTTFVRSPFANLNLVKRLAALPGEEGISLPRVKGR